MSPSMLFFIALLVCTPVANALRCHGGSTDIGGVANSPKECNKDEDRCTTMNNAGKTMYSCGPAGICSSECSSTDGIVCCCEGDLCNSRAISSAGAASLFVAIISSFSLIL